AHVRAGQALARLDSAIYDTNVREARLNLENARIALKMARSRAVQAEELKKYDLISGGDFNKAQGDAEQAEGALKIAQTALARARLDLERCDLRAPIGGEVIECNVRIGQSASTGSSAPPLFIIADTLRRMVVEAAVVEADVGTVAPGQEATFTVDAFPGRTFAGTVESVGSSPTA